MDSRPAFPTSARFEGLRPILPLALVLGVLSGCGRSNTPPEPQPNEPPGTARIEAERTQANIREAVTFRCVAEDPEGGALLYDFDWNGESTSTTPERLPSGTKGEARQTFTREGVFAVRCRAQAPRGVTGPWSEPVSITVVDPAPPGTLGVQVEVLGRGRVVSTPEGIQCGATCSKRFMASTSLTLQATPEDGWVFSGWDGCEGRRAAAYTFTLEQDVRCVARFAPDVERVAEWRWVDANLPREAVWSPDGRWLAAADNPSGSVDAPGALRVWEAATGKVKRLFRVATGSFGAAAWSPDGTLLAAGRSDGVIALLDLETGATVREWKAHEGRITTLTWRPDGARLASASSDARPGAVRLWNASTGTQESALSAGESIRRLAWSPDGSRIAVELSDTKFQNPRVELHVPGIQGPQRVLEGAQRFVWSPDGSRFAVGGTDVVRVHDTASGAVTATWEDFSWNDVRLLDWSPDGRWLAVGNISGTHHVVEADTGTLTVDLSDPLIHRYGVSGYDHLRFHPTEPVLALTAAVPGALNLFTLDVAAGSSSKRELILHDRVNRVAWNTAGEQLATSGYEGTIILWNREGTRLRTLSGTGMKSIDTLSWDERGYRLAAGTEDGRVYVWNMETGKLTPGPLVHGEGVGVSHVAMTPDGIWVASAAPSPRGPNEPGTVRVWVVPYGSEWQFPKVGGATAVQALRWMPDNDTLVGVYLDGTWSLWYPYRQLHQLVRSGLDFSQKSSLAAAISPDGRWIALGGRPGLTVHDVYSGELRFRGPDGIEPTTLEWSPDGQRIAGSTHGGLVFVRTVDSPRSSVTIVGGMEGAVDSISWRADGRALTARSQDETGTSVVTWPVAP
ncbi:WD40 repeat domain-containing protein [Pyxidicoccus fallax]|uniref:WD40 repeat domain-containing protein n=1 Tax=Pyxidicoccus fallax TaxID=394095 RepID=A0A848LY28_9BACT|nr:WD40 repeat domain-containing protein [Pyxidicoccus fallax]NMO22985.1 WD40 repeat domain-containing protein [Pyxidicoccus fallax]NPC85484.1 WD40 repeat domain-containing protein [Pyxidicoccus fallax]